MEYLQKHAHTIALLFAILLQTGAAFMWAGTVNTKLDFMNQDIKMLKELVLMKK